MKTKKWMVVRIILYLLVGGVLIISTYEHMFNTTVHIPTPGQLWLLVRPDGIPASVKWKYVELVQQYKMIGSIIKCGNVSGIVYWTAGAGTGVGPWERDLYDSRGDFIGGTSGSDVGGVPELPVDLSMYDCAPVVRL